MEIPVVVNLETFVVEQAKNLLFFGKFEEIFRFGLSSKVCLEDKIICKKIFGQI